MIILGFLFMFLTQVILRERIQIMALVGAVIGERLYRVWILYFGGLGKRCITLHYAKFAHARLRGRRPRRSDTSALHSARPLSPVSSLPLQPVSARAAFDAVCS